MKHDFFKRVFAIIITITTIISAAGFNTVLAADISLNLSYNSENYSLHVSGSTGNANESFTIMILPENMDISELSDTNLPSDMRISMTDSNGNFSELIMLSENLEGGVYSVYIFTNENLSEPRKFIHINADEALGIIKQIDNCGSGQAVYGILSANAVKVGMNPDVILSDGKFIGEMVYAHKPDGGYSNAAYPSATLLEVYNIAIICSEIKSGGNIDMLLNNNSEILNISYSDYSALSPHEQTKLHTALKTLDYTKGTFSDLFKEQIFLAKLSCADRWSKLKEIILLDGETYGIHTGAGSDYAALSNKDNVFKAMLSDGIQSISSTEQAIAIYRTAVLTQAQKEKKGDMSNLPDNSDGGTIVVKVYPDGTEKNVGFNDIDNNWAKDIILKLASKDIISGFDDETFRPSENVTRAEFIKMICAVMGFKSSEKDIFNDVKINDWFYPYIGSAFDNRIITGDGENFYPNNNISRQEAAVIVYRCISDKLSKETADFGDSAEIAEYASEAIGQLAANGIMQGTENLFRPSANLTRAESAALLNNILNFEEEYEVNNYVNNSKSDKDRDKAYDKMISILTALGMEESGKDFDEELTTGEFINLLVTLVNRELADNADDIKTPFDGIPLGHPYASAINAALQTGFISSEEAPQIDEHIKASDAIKMVVAALGYSDYVRITDSNYLHTAYELGIFKGTENLRVDAALTYYNSVAILNNMLQANPFEFYSGVNGKYDFAKSGKTYLEAHYGVDSAIGIVEADSYTSLNDSSGSVGSGNIKIGSEVYSFAGIDSLLGHRVKYYYINKNNVQSPTILYMEDKSTVIKETPIDMTYENMSYQYGEKGNKEASLDRGFSFIYNGKAYNDYTDEDMIPDSGFVTLIDNDNDGAYEVVNVESYYHMYIQQVNPTYSTIHDRNGSKTLDMSSNNTIYTIFDDVSESEIDISELESEDVIAYASSKDGEINILHRLDCIKGILTGTEDEAIYIDGIKYDTNSYFKKYYKSSLIIGTEAEFCIDVNGRIAVMRNIDNDKYRYAWLVNIYKDDSGEYAYAKLFDQSGTMRVLKLSKTVVVNKNKYKNAVDDSNFWETFRKDDKTVRQLVRYRLDSNSCLKVINTSVDINSREYKDSAFRTDLPKDGNLICYYDATKSDKLRFVYRPKSFGNLFNISSTKFLFVVPETEAYVNDDSYYAIGYNSFNTGASYKVSAYNLDLAGCAETAVYHVNLNEAAVRQSTSGVVESIKTAVDDDGEVCRMITVYNGEYTDLYVPMNISTDDCDTGDYIRYNIHTNGKVTKITKDFDYSDWAVIYGNTADKYDCTAGQIYSFQNNYIMLSETMKEDGTFDMNINSLKNYKLDSYAVYDSKSKCVITANTEDIRVYINDKNEASKVFIRFENSMNTGYAVIYI